MQVLRPDRTQSLLWRAFLASLLVHAVVALVIPVWTHSQSGGAEPVETLSFAHIVRIHMERPKTPQPVPKLTAPRTPHRDSRIRFARVRSELTKNTRKLLAHTPPPQVGPQGQFASAPKAEKEQTQIPRVAQAVLHTPDAITTPPVPQATPQPQASSNRDVSGTGSHETGGVMPFGASMAQPVLDPKVQHELVSRFRVHVELHVTVGDDGKTKSVAFVPPVDRATERAIEVLLADANWDAAVCGGGIACEGTAVIRL